MKKKLISAVLALVIVLGLLPMAVFAEDASSIEGEGKTAWLNTGTEYTVSEYLADASLDGIIDEATGKLATGKTLRDLQSAAANFLHAQKADESTEDSAKEATAAAIAVVQAKYDAVTKLDLSNVEGLTDLGVLAPFTGLTELDISDNAGITSLAPLATCTKLAKLTAKNLTLDDINGLYVLLNDEDEDLEVTRWDLTGTTLRDPGTDMKAVWNWIITTLGDKAAGMIAYPADPSAPVTYNIIKAAAVNGSFTVKVDSEEVGNAAAGASVVITATASQGYEVDEITVKDADDSDVNVTDGAFTMPAKGVTVTVTFKQGTPVDPPAGLPMIVVAPASSDTDIFGKAVSEMGKFSFTTNGTTITAAGSASYVTGYTGFWADNEEMQKGHFLPFHVEIKNVGTDGGTLTVNNGNTAPVTQDDCEGDIVFRMDGGSSFELKYTEGGTTVTVTVNFSGVTMKLNPEDAVEYTPYDSNDPEYHTWLGGHLKLKGLQANNYYLVQLGAKSARAYQVLQANGSGVIELIAQPGATLQVALIGASNTDVATFLNNGWILDIPLATLPATPTT